MSAHPIFRQEGFKQVKFAKFYMIPLIQIRTILPNTQKYQND